MKDEMNRRTVSDDWLEKGEQHVNLMVVLLLLLLAD